MRWCLRGWIVGLIAVALGGWLGACDRPEAVLVAPAAEPDAEKGPEMAAPVDVQAVVAPGRPTDALAPARQIPWVLPRGPQSDPEKAVSGTWVATVGDFATRAEAMAGSVMLNLDGRSKKQGLVEATLAAIERDDRLATNCIWLELFPDRSGIRRGCALIGGEPSALDKTDPFGGQKSAFGTRLQWYFDLPSKEVRIRFDEDMLVPATADGGSRMLRFRHWSLAFGQRAGKGFKMIERIPEHDYTLPIQYAYEIFPGSFLKKR